MARGNSGAPRAK